MRRPVIAANWKMYKTQAETRAFFAAFKPLAASATHCDLLVAPPYTALAAASEAVRGSAIAIGAQDLYWEKEGAFTGEISARMLLEAGCSHVLVGHSERRHIFDEWDEHVEKKLCAALAAGLIPVLCVGETLAQREAAETESVLRRQFTSATRSLTPDHFSRILMAYEPV